MWDRRCVGICPLSSCRQRCEHGLMPCSKTSFFLQAALFSPLSAHFSGLPCAERWYLTFSDSCPFCCQCWCPRPKPSPRGTPLRPRTHAGSSVCVCVCASIHVFLSPCLCVCSHAPPQCLSGTTVRLQPGLCPRALSHSVSRVPRTCTAPVPSANPPSI